MLVFDRLAAPLRRGEVKQVRCLIAIVVARALPLSLRARHPQMLVTAKSINVNV